MTELVQFFEEVVGRPFYEIRVIDPSKTSGDATIARKFAQTAQEAADFALDPKYANYHVFFGACPRKEHSGKKEAVHSCWTLWADLDTPEIPDHALALPPSYIVFTGHGHHLYWRLVQPHTDVEAVEAELRQVQAFSQGDRVCDISRVLRVPGTFNVKDNPPPQCHIVAHTRAVYEMGDFTAANKVPVKVLELIRSGSSEGFSSRSERDWHVICELVKAGMSDTAIKTIFSIEPIGDKVREAPDDHYLTVTLEKAHREASPATLAETDYGIFEHPGQGYFRPTAQGNAVQLSTFTLKVTAILYQDGFSDESFQADVLRGSETARGVLFPRQCFLSVTTLSKYLPSMDWQWLGSDKDVRYLLAYLSEQCEKRRVRRQKYVKSVGLHAPWWVGSNIVFSPTESFESAAAPVTFAAGPTSYIETSYRAVEDADYKKQLAQLDGALAKVNTPCVVLPMLGWYMSTPYKTRLQEIGVRFPVLNIFGTRGAGKTTIVQSVWLPLMGIANPTVHDCNTTRFVLLTLLGSSNAVPIALAEFRQSSLSNTQYNVILRTVLLAYDQGRDSRGRADQSIVEYPLSAPFSIDGEDPLPDQAAKERVLAVYMNPNDICSGTASSQALETLQSLDLSFFAQNYIRWTLAQDVTALWNRATEQVNRTFPSHLPHRVRRNITVAWLGALSYAAFCKEQGVSTQAPMNPALLKASLEQVVTLQGISRMIADEFIEDLINSYAVNGATEFAMKFKAPDNIFWFHPKTAYDWWAARRAREGRAVLDFRSVKHQLQERQVSNGSGGAYIVNLAKNTRATMQQAVFAMAGVDVDRAREAGLEIPDITGENFVDPS